MTQASPDTAKSEMGDKGKGWLRSRLIVSDIVCNASPVSEVDEPDRDSCSSEDESYSESAFKRFLGLSPVSLEDCSRLSRFLGASLVESPGWDSVPGPDSRTDTMRHFSKMRYTALCLKLTAEKIPV